MSNEGGVFFAEEQSSLTVAGGLFYKNKALDGGVAFLNNDAALLVLGGTFSGNVADNGGGAFYVGDGGQLKVSQRGERRGWGATFFMPWRQGQYR